MTEKEQNMKSKIEMFMYENTVSSDFFVEIIKLCFQYGSMGGVSYLAKANNCSKQYIYRVSEKIDINSITIYRHES